MDTGIRWYGFLVNEEIKEVNIKMGNSINKLLCEVSIIRPMVIFLLVVMHSFTMFQDEGKWWPLPSGIEPVETYKWIAKITYSFMLEMFVFISGYLLAYQFLRHKQAFLLFSVKKAKRLLLPSILFSIVYFAIFFEYKGLPDYIYSILNGSGHMWYLPMIFWCFIGGYILMNIEMPDWMKLAACLLLSIVSGLLGFLPFRLGKSCYYLFFFYLGMYLYPRRKMMLEKLSSNKILLIVILYLTSFAVLSLFKDYLHDISTNSILLLVVKSSIYTTSTILYAALGLLAMYCATVYWLHNHPNWQPSSLLIKANEICFGVYIYQQFILMILYYKTTLPKFTETHVLPWVGCIITLFMSIMLSQITIRTRFGRFLIG